MTHSLSITSSYTSHWLGCSSVTKPQVSRAIWEASGHSVWLQDMNQKGQRFLEDLCNIFQVCAVIWYLRAFQMAEATHFWVPDIWVFYSRAGHSRFSHLVCQTSSICVEAGVPIAVVCFLTLYLNVFTFWLTVSTLWPFLFQRAQRFWIVVSP